MSTIGKSIKKLREQKGISQDRLSKLSDIFSNTNAKLELDRLSSTIDTLKKIASTLNVKIEQLIQ
jgi:transcriptional regulator with XRE-family HTH domain